MKTTRDDPTFPREFERCRYEEDGARLILTPYAWAEGKYPVDLFGRTLPLIETNDSSGWFASYEDVPGSGAEVSAKTAEAAAFLSIADWQAGVWQIRAEENTIDLFLRPDGIYSATNTTEVLRRVLRGRYTLAGA